MGCMRMADRARPVARVRVTALGAALAALVLALGGQGAGGPAAAWAARGAVVHFRGHQVRVPASWPVYRLSRHPRMCVRLDRRAVYVGAPSASQRCPAHAVGRRRAILLDPGVAARPARATARASSASGGASTPRASAATSAPFSGLGFDACAAPSSRTMSAWASSPYGAVGVYIGGANRACSQPNLTPTWVGDQVGAGWRLIPTYVGLQAPTSSCGSCAKLSANKATGQGTAQAEDAVEDAKSVGIGPGNPIYFDMEAYTRTSSASRATLTFLAAWTERLHALGYVSGVYSSSASGIADIAREIGTGYPLPDDLWMANWNGREDTLDPYVPSTSWSNHQRIHQFRGGHNETYGGATINIDGDYVEGATVGTGTPTPPPPPPLAVSRVKPVAGTVRVRVRCGWAEGETCPGQIILRSHIRIRVRARGARPVKTRVVRVAVARRAFRLAGGRSHTFLVVLNSRGRPLLHEAGTLKARLLVAIPGARAVRAVKLRRAH
jgi:Rv2525c-like, glycoside hydrolase-like domain